jgi:very-short-patch-repair endonuclease
MPKKRRSKYESELEEKFLGKWRKTYPQETIKTQHQFHSIRKWRFDFAFVNELLAIEIQGFGPGHNSYKGMATDYEKHNEAIRFGWAVIYLMQHDVDDKMIRRTMSYVYNTLELRRQSNLDIKTPDTETPQEMFSRMKASIRRKR